MSRLQEPQSAQLLISILSSSWTQFWPGLLQQLEGELGRADFVSAALDFTETSYYDQELGTPITRKILAFEPLLPQQELVRCKLYCQELERAGSRLDGRRLFNLDPGILCLERLVLATGKNFTHRIYLDQGVFADLTLIYTKGGWQALPWTYPDYAGNLVQDILSWLRDRYKQKLKAREK